MQLSGFEVAVGPLKLNQELPFGFISLREGSSGPTELISSLVNEVGELVNLNVSFFITSINFGTNQLPTINLEIPSFLQIFYFRSVSSTHVAS